MSASNPPRINGYMQDTENAFMLSYGKKFRLGIPMGSYHSGGTDFQIGGNAKFLYNSVSGANRNAIGFAGDMGIIWKTSSLLGSSAQDFPKDLNGKRLLSQESGNKL